MDPDKDKAALKLQALQILCLSPTTNPNPTVREIRSAYKRLSLLYHPDKNPGDPSAQEQFVRLKEACDLLVGELGTGDEGDGSQDDDFHGARRGFGSGPGGGSRGFGPGSESRTPASENGFSTSTAFTHPGTHDSGVPMRDAAGNNIVLPTGLAESLRTAREHLERVRGKGRRKRGGEQFGAGEQVKRSKLVDLEKEEKDEDVVMSGSGSGDAYVYESRFREGFPGPSTASPSAYFQPEAGHSPAQSPLPPLSRTQSGDSGAFRPPSKQHSFGTFNPNFNTSTSTSWSKSQIPVQSYISSYTSPYDPLKPAAPMPTGASNFELSTSSTSPLSFTSQNQNPIPQKHSQNRTPSPKAQPLSSGNTFAFNNTRPTTPHHTSPSFRRGSNTNQRPNTSTAFTHVPATAPATANLTVSAEVNASTRRGGRLSDTSRAAWRAETEEKGRGSGVGFGDAGGVGRMGRVSAMGAMPFIPFRSPPPHIRTSTQTPVQISTRAPAPNPPTLNTTPNPSPINPLNPPTTLNPTTYTVTQILSTPSLLNAWVTASWSRNRTPIMNALSQSRPPQAHPPQAHPPQNTSTSASVGGTPSLRGPLTAENENESAIAIAIDSEIDIDFIAREFGTRMLRELGEYDTMSQEYAGASSRASASAEVHTHAQTHAQTHGQQENMERK